MATYKVTDNRFENQWVDIKGFLVKFENKVAKVDSNFIAYFRDRPGQFTIEGGEDKPSLTPASVPVNIPVHPEPTKEQLEEELKNPPEINPVQPVKKKRTPRKKTI